jgi:hypothetical protein
MFQVRVYAAEHPTQAFAGDFPSFGIIGIRHHSQIDSWRVSQLHSSYSSACQLGPHPYQDLIIVRVRPTSHLIIPFRSDHTSFGNIG